MSFSLRLCGSFVMFNVHPLGPHPAGHGGGANNGRTVPISLVHLSVYWKMTKMTAGMLIIIITIITIIRVHHRVDFRMHNRGTFLQLLLSVAGRLISFFPSCQSRVPPPPPSPPPRQLQDAVGLAWTRTPIASSGCCGPRLDPNTIANSGWCGPRLDPNTCLRKCQMTECICQIECLIECQKVCQNRCQVKCQKVCQNTCQIVPNRMFEYNVRVGITWSKVIYVVNRRIKLPCGDECPQPFIAITKIICSWVYINLYITLGYVCPTAGLWYAAYPCTNWDAHPNGFSCWSFDPSDSFLTRTHTESRMVKKNHHMFESSFQVELLTL